jgi:predicted RNA binding protein YcfA (HicA-like mRNA interferase family)
MKYRDLIKRVENDGWQFLRMNGSHGQYKHPTKPGIVTIVSRPGKDVPIGTLKSILPEAGRAGVTNAGIHSHLRAG